MVHLRLEIVDNDSKEIRDERHSFHGLVKESCSVDFFSQTLESMV